MKKIIIKLSAYNIILMILFGMGSLASAQELNPPIADFTWVTDELSVNFTDTSTDDGTIVAWSWDFGDGNSSDLQNVNYIYEFEGTYAVNLTVTDDQGLTNSTEKNVTVSITPQQDPPLDLSICSK